MLRALELVMVLLAGIALGAAAFAWRDRLLESAGKSAQVAEELVDGMADRVAVPKAIRFEPPRVMRTIYLNREGARLRSGADDSTVNQSSIVAHAGMPHADIPAFAGALARWNAIVSCIRGVLAPFDVRVVDTRPVGEDFMMAMMGGAVAVLGDFGKKSHHAALGLSPYNGQPIENAIVLVFTRASQENARKVCETAGMEIGHAYGLDHARHCGDLMTYMPGCGKKKFVDKDLACGEHKDRPCTNGLQRQNSHAYLMNLLGPAPAR